MFVVHGDLVDHNWTLVQYWQELEGNRMGVWPNSLVACVLAFVVAFVVACAVAFVVACVVACAVLAFVVLCRRELGQIVQTVGVAE